MKQALLTLLFCLSIHSTAFAENKETSSTPIDPCTKLGGKIKLVIRLKGEKEGQKEPLCVFAKTAILETTLQKEIIKQRTTALDKLAASEFNKSKAAIRKLKVDYLNKESDAVKNCRLKGGIIFELKDYNGPLNFCRWDDYSGIEVEAFYRGRRDLGNAKVLSIRKIKK